jgi:hypothetical protein
VELDPDFEAIVTIGGHKSGATLRLARLRKGTACWWSPIPWMDPDKGPPFFRFRVGTPRGRAGWPCF